MGAEKHLLRVGRARYRSDDTPDPSEFRNQVEPWLSSVFQTEHLSVLLGSGFTLGIAAIAGVAAAAMSPISREWQFTDDCTQPQAAELEAAIKAAAKASADHVGRGNPNIEDELRSAMALLSGLEVLGDTRRTAVEAVINSVLTSFLNSVLATERALNSAFVADSKRGLEAQHALTSFLLSFASRTASRERLNVFTSNYDRLIECGCDLAGLRVVDRFVGVLNPMFRSSRVDVDLHYNPPGIRGEPRYLEGVIRIGKLHGSLDWRFENGDVRRIGLRFGATDNHPEIPKDPFNTVIIYPNPAKDVETFDFPYAEIFRDFSAALCRPNAALVTYGYGFGDDHINRVIRHMLSLSSTHVVIIAFDDRDGRIQRFCDRVGRDAQISLMIGPHFGALPSLIEHYLPKPAIDPIQFRMHQLLANRGQGETKAEPGDKANDDITR
ncbi:MAG: SIR2 family protein [Acidobacteriota bacterium]